MRPEPLWWAFQREHGYVVGWKSNVRFPAGKRGGAALYVTNENVIYSTEAEAQAAIDKLKRTREGGETMSEDQAYRLFYEDNARLVVKEMFPMLSAKAQAALIELLCDFLVNLDVIATNVGES